MLRQKMCESVVPALGIAQQSERLDRDSSERLKQLESNAIAIIGYQLWTPLSVIQACLELLERPEESRSAEGRVMVELALKETTGLVELVRECLGSFDALDPSDDVLEDSIQVGCPLLPTFNLLREALLERHSDGVLACGVEPRRKTDRVDEAIESAATAAIVLTPSEELQQLRRKLIAIVGHELRTPLCSLRACLEIFLSDAETLPHDHRHTLLELCRSDLERLRRLVQQFFMLARLEKGLVLQTRGWVDLHKTVELVVSGLQTQHRAALPAIRLDVPDSLPLLQVDEDKLVVALVQLLSNAYQFTGAAGQIDIAVRLHASGQDERDAQSDRRMVEVVVTDTGCGISPEHLNKVFDCFYQEEDFLRREVGGTGIGLAICRQLIEGMGGKIWARSLGKAMGSCIHLMLPAVSQPVLAVA